MVTPPDDDRPTVLILGGLGLIGRHLARYIADHRLARRLRIVDKRPPPTAFLAPPFAAALEGAEVVQADLSEPRGVAAAFGGAGDDGGGPWAVVVNAAAESARGHAAGRYARHIADLRRNCAAAAKAAGGVERYIEVSTTEVYGEREEGDTLCGENDQTAPVSEIGKAHLEGERAVEEAGLPWIIARVATGVYGPGETGGLMPGIACAALYAGGEEALDWMWDEGTPMETIHAQDAAAALWHLACAGEVGQVYNVVDEGSTTQGHVARILKDIFNIKVNFLGTMITKIASHMLDKAREEANDQHLRHWLALLRHYGIRDTPVTPYIEKEYFLKHPRASGEKLRKTGFRCSCPVMTTDLVRDSINYWRNMQLFPPEK